jgi:hypothetical protein
MPGGWTSSAGGFPAMTERVAFLMKDFVILASSFYLLKQDVVRASVFAIHLQERERGQLESKGADPEDLCDVEGMERLTSFLRCVRHFRPSCLLTLSPLVASTGSVFEASWLYVVDYGDAVGFSSKRPRG